MDELHQKPFPFIQLKDDGETWYLTEEAKSKLDNAHLKIRPVVIVGKTA